MNDYVAMLAAWFVALVVWLALAAAADEAWAWLRDSVAPHGQGEARRGRRADR